MDLCQNNMGVISKSFFSFVQFPSRMESSYEQYFCIHYLCPLISHFRSCNSEHFSLLGTLHEYGLALSSLAYTKKIFHSHIIQNHLKHS